MPLQTLHTFQVQHLCILDADGGVDETLLPDLSGETLQSLYQAMVLAREADQRQIKLQRQGRVGTFPPCTGQEATACGAALALRPDDWLVPAFRELGALLMRGVPLASYFRYYNGFEEGNFIPPGGRTLPTSVIVGSQALHAVGIAHAMRLQGEHAAVLVFIGDGGTSEGDFYEALNFAGVWRAPVVFVVQNNGWAISTPRSQQSAAQTLAQKGIAAGIPGLQVDGNDALAVYKATADALARARAGDGPTLIEALTYRVMMHTTSDDPRKYRDEGEEQEWWARDPIPRLERFLRARGLLDDEGVEAALSRAREQVEDAVRALESPQTHKPDAPFDHVFGTEHAHIEAQRAQFLARVQAEADHG